MPSPRLWCIGRGLLQDALLGWLMGPLGSAILMISFARHLTPPAPGRHLLRMQGGFLWLIGNKSSFGRFSAEPWIRCKWSSKYCRPAPCLHSLAEVSSWAMMTLISPCSPTCLGSQWGVGAGQPLRNISRAGLASWQPAAAAGQEGKALNKGQETATWCLWQGVWFGQRRFVSKSPKLTEWLASPLGQQHCNREGPLFFGVVGLHSPTSCGIHH